jgi:hypothetical protein
MKQWELRVSQALICTSPIARREWPDIQMWQRAWACPFPPLPAHVSIVPSRYV